jgi:hypothetical protein
MHCKKVHKEHKATERAQTAQSHKKCTKSTKLQCMHCNTARTGTRDMHIHQRMNGLQHTRARCQEAARTRSHKSTRTPRRHSHHAQGKAPASCTQHCSSSVGAQCPGRGGSCGGEQVQGACCRQLRRSGAEWQNSNRSRMRDTGTSGGQIKSKRGRSTPRGRATAYSGGDRAPLRVANAQA